jgi:capsular polysaccharide biosynthesis protein
VNNTNKIETEEEKYDYEITLMDLIFIVFRGWRIILISTIIVGVAGAVFSFMKPEVYEAKAKLMVSRRGIYSSKQLDANDISINQKLVMTYTEVAKSNSVLKEVVKKLDMDMSIREIAGKLRVEPVEDTEFINIYYKDTNAHMSARIANEISKEFIQKIKNIMKFENLNIVEIAEAPEYPSGIEKKLIVAISLVLGGFIGVFIVFVLEFFKNKIRKPMEIERITGCIVIASIPNFAIVEENKKKR